MTQWWGYRGTLDPKKLPKKKQEPDRFPFPWAPGVEHENDRSVAEYGCGGEIAKVYGVPQVLYNEWLCVAMAKAESEPTRYEFDKKEWEREHPPGAK